MAFDYAAARKAGYSDAEIADHLSQGALFDAAAARKAGYSDAEIVQHLQAKEAQRAARDSSKPVQAAKPAAAPKQSSEEATRLARGAFGKAAPVQQDGPAAATVKSMRPENPLDVARRQNADVSTGSMKAATAGDLIGGENRGEKIDVAHPGAVYDPGESWGETGSKIAKHIIPGFKASLGGAIQGMAENQSDVIIGPDGMAQRITLPEGLPDGPTPGEAMQREAAADLAGTAFRPGDNLAKYYAGQLADSLIQMVPSIAATIATRSPGVGMGTMFGQVGGQQYGESRNEGRSKEQASVDALYMGVTEILGEKLVLGRILAPGGGKLLGETLKTAGMESAQEMVTQVLQTGYEAGVLKHDMTLGEAMRTVIDAGILGAGMGTAMHVTGHPFKPKAEVGADGRITSRAPDDTRVAPAGVRQTAEATAATPTQADIDSPLDTADIVAGRTQIAKAEGSKKADTALQQHGLPTIGERVVVDMGDGVQHTGSMEDWFEADDGKGVVVKLDNGKTIREYTDTLADAGVSIRPESPLAEADALDAELAAQAAKAPVLPVAEQSSPVSSPATSAAPVAGPTPKAGAAPSVAIDNFMAKTRRAESGGDDNAKNPRSSASGRYQFTDKTWIITFRAEYPGDRKSDEEILALKGDAATQERLMRRLTKDNAAALARGGHDVTEGNLYLAHFAGSGGANALLNANPNASAESVLGAGVIKANPFLKGKTAGEVVAWAAGKMGGAAPAIGRSAFDQAPSAKPEDIAFSDPEFTGVKPLEIERRDEPAADLAGKKIDEEWTTFKPETGTLGIPRADMPQIKAELRGAMVNFLNARGISHEEVRVPASSLKPSQAEFSPAKVEKAQQYEGGDRAILISSDGHVVDGHHQWLAAREAGVDVRAIQLNAPIRDALAAAHEFPSSTTAEGATDAQTPAQTDKASEQSNLQETQSAPASQVSFEDTPSGKGFAVIGASPAELAAIASQVPQAKASQRKDGAQVYPVKWAAEIRAAVAGTSEQVAPAVDDSLRARPELGPTFADPSGDVSRAGLLNAAREGRGNSTGEGDRRWLIREGYAETDRRGKIAGLSEKGHALLADYTAQGVAGTSRNDERPGPTSQGADQLAHIASERARILELKALRDRIGQDHDGSLSMGGEYHAGANALGFHPLTDAEISARLAELDDMQAKAEGRPEPEPKAEPVSKADDLPAEAAPDAESERRRKMGAKPAGTAPEHAQVGVDDVELSQIVQEFNAAQSVDNEITHVFDPPKKGEVVRLADKARVYHAQHGWMTPAEARAKIDEWKAHAEAQGGPGSKNSDKVVLSLFDLTGKWSQPWEDAGYQVYRFDIQDDPEVGDVHNFSTEFFGDWFGDFDGQDIYAVLAACPCTDFASSGARHFAAKDADRRTVASVKLVHKTLAVIEYFKPAVWAIENPVGRIEKLGGLPPFRLSFDPNHVGEDYTKKTLLWGRFNADLPIAPTEATEGSKMHAKYGGKSMATKNARSATPEGFAYSFFMANNAIDNQAMAIANKYDRLDRGLIEKAVAAGVTPAQIDEAVEDFYYQELDDEAANEAIAALAGVTPPPKGEPAPKQLDLLQPAASAPLPDASNRIEDFGEKIGGARKDVWTSYKDRLKDADSVDIAAEPLSKSWPEPDYEKLVEAGVDPYTVAWVHAARDEIPTQPQKGWKLKGWVENVDMLRRLAGQLITGEIEGAAVKEKMLGLDFRRALSGLQGRVDLYERFGHAQSFKGISFSSHFFSLYRGERNVTKWTIEQKAKATAFSNWPRELAVADTREDVLDKFAALLESGGLAKKKPSGPKFEIYSRRTVPGQFIIGVKVGKELVDLKTFPTAAEARAFKGSEAGYAELQASLEQYKDIPSERKAANSPRIGINHRDGADVSPLQFGDTFGFRGVQFGNYVESARRQADLNEAYDALMDLAGVLDVPTRALSLNGELGLAFGARGKGGKGAASAHYEPGSVVINLTKNEGAGAIAHEWWHALDNYFSRSGGARDGYMTGGVKSEGVRPEVVEAFRNVIQTVNSTGLKQRSQNLDKRRTKDYWSTDIEMSARAFESYVIARLQDEQFSNDYLANIVPESAFGLEDGYPYPLASEIPAVRAAYDDLFHKLEVEDTAEGGKRLYSISDAEPVASLTGNELGVEVNGPEDMPALREAARAYYQRELIGQTVTSSDGHDVEFSTRGMRKVASKGPDLIRAIPAIPAIIERGDLIDTRPGRDPSTKAMHLYAADVSIDGAAKRLGVFVRETYDGHYQYDLTSVRDDVGSRSSTDGVGTEVPNAPALEGAPDEFNLFDVDADFNRGAGERAPGASDIAALRTDLKARLAGLGLSDRVQLNVVEALTGKAEGRYWPGRRVIEVLLGAKDAGFILDHEAIHALRDMGVFTATDWKILTTAARNTPDLWRSINQRYAQLDLAAREEEAVADLFARYQRGDFAPKGMVERLFIRLVKLLAAARNAFRGQGFTTPRTFFEVLDEVASGKAATREGQGEAGKAFVPAFGKKGASDSVFGTDGTPAPKDAIPEPLNDVGNHEFEAIAAPANRKLLDGLKGPDLRNVQDKVDEWRVWLQDKMLPVLRLQDAIAHSLSRDLAESENPYLAEELMTGRVGARIGQLTEQIIDPLFQAMHENGISIDEFETFLYARHATERNARISAINEEFDEGTGSGMTDIEARAVLNRIAKAGQREAMDALAAYVDRMNRDALETRVEAGLLSREEADSYLATYEHYVPLRGQEEVMGDVKPIAARIRSQSGNSVRGKEGKAAFGRRSQADNILSYAILQAEEAIVRAEKNAVAQAFVKLAQASPDPKFWKVNKIERRPVMDKKTGLVRYENQSRLAAEDADVTVTAKVDGEEVHVTMDRTNVKAVALAEAMRNLNDPQFNAFLRMASTFNRYFSAINTRYNPSFVVTNAIRDIQTMAVISQQYEDDMPGFTRHVMRDYLKAAAASTWIGKKIGGVEYDAAWDAWRREWELAGGKVFFNDARDLEAIRKSLNARAKLANSPNGAARVWKTTFDYLEAANESVERAIRLSVYKNAREAGKTKAQAASMARNVTVNFTRRGKYSPVMNAFYAFFNASVQGNVNLVRAAVKSKRVRRAMYGFIIAGFLSDLLNSMMTGEDDDGESFWDKMPDHEKSRNIVFMMPGDDGGKAFKIPLAYGLNALFGLGRNVSAMMRGAMTPGEAALGSAKEFADAFNPIGSGGSWINVIAPTALDPLADAFLTNKDFTGKPIQPEQNPFNSPVTPSGNYFPNVNGLAKATAQGLNSATGGDAVLPGLVSVSPEVIEYLTGFLTGGAGRFVSDFAKLAVAPFDPESDVTVRDVPIAKALVTEKAPWVDKSLYYERVHQVEAVIDHAKAYIERGDDDGLSRYAAANGKIAEMEAATKEASRIMRKIRKARNEASFQHELGRIDDASYREVLQDVKAREDDLIFRYNSRWNAVMDAKPEPEEAE